jgi:hypothetical protein
VTAGLGPELRGALLVINGHEGKACGLELIDGQGVLDNPSKVPAMALEANRSHVLLVAAEASQGIASVVAAVDDKPIVRWRGPVTSLSMTKDWPADRLVISSHRTSVAIESVELRLRSGGAWRMDY